MIPFKEHKCGDSKLRCIDCDSQICPKCMIQCPVGNRCPNCTKRFTSHVLQVDPWVLLRGLLGGVVAGLAFSLLQTLCPIGGFYILLFVYLIGVFAGNMVFKIAGRKLGGKMATSVAFGAIIGSFVFVLLCHGFFSVVMPQSANEDFAQPELYQSAHNTSIERATKEDADESEMSQKSQMSETPNIAYLKPPRHKMSPLALAAASPISFSFILFVLGLISPFLGWNFSWPGFRR